MQRLCKNCDKELKQGENHCPTCGHQSTAEAEQLEKQSKASERAQERKPDVHEDSGDGTKKLIIYFVAICLVLGGIMLLSLYVFKNSDYMEESLQTAIEPVAVEIVWDQGVDPNH